MPTLLCESDHVRAHMDAKADALGAKGEGDVLVDCWRGGDRFLRKEDFDQKAKTIW
jgi:hypothetical protein